MTTEDEVIMVILCVLGIGFAYAAPFLWIWLYELIMGWR